MLIDQLARLCIFLRPTGLLISRPNEPKVGGLEGSKMGKPRMNGLGRP